MMPNGKYNPEYYYKDNRNEIRKIDKMIWGKWEKNIKVPIKAPIEKPLIKDQNGINLLEIE